MAATGNEAARLEQLKGVFPQAVSFVGSRGVSVTLGNGKIIEFSASSGGNSRVHLLVRVMYNSFELLQAAVNGPALTISVSSNGSMETFGMKKLGEKEGKIYAITNVSLTPVSVNRSKTLFTASDDPVVFIGALIYVD